MNIQKLKDFMKKADEIENPTESEIAERTLAMFDELHRTYPTLEIESSGNTAGLIVPKTRTGGELPLLAGFLLPLVVPDYLTLKDTNSSATINDLPQDIRNKLKEIAEKHGFSIVSIEELKNIGVNLEEFFTKYVYY